MPLNPKTLAMVNLLVQVLLIMTVLVAAYFAKRKRQFIRHCRIIRVAVVLQLLAIFLIMLPSLSGYLENPGPTFRTEMLVHHGLGLLLVLLWVYINLAVMGRVRVVGGRLPIFMRTALSVWTLAFLLGLHLYFQIYALP